MCMHRGEAEGGSLGMGRSPYRVAALCRCFAGTRVLCMHLLPPKDLKKGKRQLPHMLIWLKIMMFHCAWL
jgi:hypothetical protein